MGLKQQDIPFLVQLVENPKYDLPGFNIASHLVNFISENPRMSVDNSKTDPLLKPDFIHSAKLVLSNPLTLWGLPPQIHLIFIKKKSSMRRTSLPALFTAIILVGLASFSCSSSRYQQGFSYKPAYSAPDISSGLSEDNVSKHPSPTLEPKTDIIEVGPLATTKLSSETAALATIITQQYEETQSVGSEVNSREIIHQMAADFANTQNKELTNKQLRQLDRYVTKMEKKNHRGANDVNWGPSNNLEWFVLLGAGVGLVVGILGIGFGWFVFLGLALVYLYLKLIKNN